MKSLVLRGVAALSMALLLFVSPLEATVTVITASLNSTAQDLGGFSSVSSPGVIAAPSGTTTATRPPVVATTMHTFTQNPSPTSLTGDITLDTGTAIAGIAGSNGTLALSVDVNTPYTIEGMFHYTAPTSKGSTGRAGGFVVSPEGMNSVIVGRSG